MRNEKKKLKRNLTKKKIKSKKIRGRMEMKNKKKKLKRNLTKKKFKSN